MAHSLEARDYLEEFCKLDFNDRQELGTELMLNQFGYFMFDTLTLPNIYTRNLYIINNLYKADKIYLGGSYSYIYAALESLIQHGLQEQVRMLDIDINNWDSIPISWKLLTKFTNLKLLYIDGSNTSVRNKIIPDITAHLPKSLEALSIVNMPYYNEPFYSGMSSSNLKVIKLLTLKFNQEISNLPLGLKILIIESGEFNQGIDNLPSSLKHLILLCPKFAAPLDNLPHGLEYFAGLHFNCFVYPGHFYRLELANLPSSIKSILLDKNLYDKHSTTIANIYKDCNIEFYENFNNFEFIFKNLLARIL
jgi:hypothetical protein